MRRFLLNLTVAIAGAVVALTPGTADAQNRNRGGGAPNQIEVNESVRNLLRDNSMTCQFDSARFVGRNSDGRTLYEVACSNEPGFLVLDTTPPQSVNCIANNASVATRRAQNPEAEVGAECTIAANTDTAAAIRNYTQAAGITCAVEQARWVGSTTAGDQRYEVACPGPEGYWFDVTPTGSVHNKLDCFQVAAAGGACEFSTGQEQATWLASLAAGSGRTCQANNSRFVGANGETGQRYFEVGCADGVGFMIRTDSNNNFESVIECAAAGGIAGGCTLSEMAAVAAASAEELQARLASAGITCEYVRSGPPRQETEGDRRTVVEFDCIDRPWGLVAFLPNASGTPDSIDCLTAQARIGGCSLTSRNMLLDNLGMLAAGRSQLASCAVSDFRMVGRLTSAQAGSENGAGDVVELRCEGGTGYITVVRPDRSAITQSQTCATSAERGGTRCELGA